MESDKFELKTTSDKEVLVKFINSMDTHEWNNFGSLLVRMLKNGFLNWRFILGKLKLATSIDIGMWVSCNATIKNYQGTAEFIIKENSTVHKTIVFTKLDQILSITLIQK